MNSALKTSLHRRRRHSRAGLLIPGTCDRIRQAIGTEYLTFTSPVSRISAYLTAGQLHLRPDLHVKQMEALRVEWGGSIWD